MRRSGIIKFVFVISPPASTNPPAYTRYHHTLLSRLSISDHRIHWSASRRASQSLSRAPYPGQTPMITAHAAQSTPRLAPRSGHGIRPNPHQLRTKPASHPHQLRTKPAPSPHQPGATAAAPHPHCADLMRPDHPRPECDRSGPP